MSLTSLKLRTSLGSILKIISVPTYGLLATALTLLVIWLFLWIFNLQLLISVLFSGAVDWADKLGFALAGFQGIATNLEPSQAASLVVFSILSGVNLSAMVYILRHGQVEGSAAGKNFLASIAAIIGSGCAVCGGSVVGPLVALFGASLSIPATRTIGIFANVIGIVLLLYSIYGLGKTAANLFAKREFQA